MISRWIRTWYTDLLNPLLRMLMKIGIGANTLTIASLVVVIVAGVLLALDRLVLAAWILLLGGFLDGLDGPLARLRGVPSPFGGFLDSICDHCGDFAIYLGLLFHAMKISAPDEVLLIFISMFASVFGSHVRSRAGTIHVDTKAIGLFTRFERIVLLFVCILLGRISAALWGLAIFNSLSALQRVHYTIQAYRKQPADPGIRETV